MTAFWAYWQRVPLKVLLAVSMACLLIKDAYPFSDFPMFSSFGESSYYVYLADQENRPVPAADFGVETNQIKKLYGASLRRIMKSLPKGRKPGKTQEAQAAAETFRYLAGHRQGQSAKLTALRLLLVDLNMEQGKVVKETRVAGEVLLP